MATNRNKVGTSVPGLMSSSPFLGGLNTELSGIVDSTDFTKDELNMLIRADGSRSRRPGVDYEEGFVFNNELVDTSKENLAFNSIEWTDINSPDEAQTYTQIPYLVVQIGSKIIFYENHGQPYSQAEIDFTLDLNEKEEVSPGVYEYTYKLDNRTEDDVATSRCKFTIAYGCLFITSNAIRPIRLRSAQKESAPLLDITYPYCKVSCSAFQGKHRRMTNCQWGPEYCEFYFNDAVIGKYEVPASTTLVNFPNSYTLAEYFNSLPASTRRYITAEPFESEPDHFTNPNTGWPRWTPDDWITFKASRSLEKGMEIKIKVYGWAYKSGDWRDHANTYTAIMAGGSSAYTSSSGLSLQIRDDTRGAIDYLPVDESPDKMSYAHLYNLLNQGWTVKLISDFYTGSSDVPEKRVFPANNLAQQYLKDTKTGAFKPEDLINMTFGNTPAARGHYLLDFFNQDRIQVSSVVERMGDLATLLSVTVDDIWDPLNAEYDPSDPERYTSVAEQQIPVIKPRRDYVADMCTYAGRIFYLCGDVLLYSQMISEDVDKANKCHSEADPTSEEISDIIETDGGFISLPDIGDGTKLAQFGEYLFVFGTRGNAVITGTANNIFTATAYSAGSLNAVPTQAPESFVNTEFGVFYWGTTGINVLGAGEGGLAVQDISTDRIMTWFGKLSNAQHKYCKGVYSISKKKVYWFYPSDDEKPRRLDCCLVYDITKGSFAPQKIATGFVDEEDGGYVEADLPEVVSGLSLKVPFKSEKEYPVIASARNFVDLSGDHIRVIDKVNLEESGCIFRLDMKGLDDLAIGDSVDILQFGDYVLQTATRTDENTINLTSALHGGHTSADRSNTDVIWYIMYFYAGYVFIRTILEDDLPASTDPYTVFSVPASISTYTGGNWYSWMEHQGYMKFYKPILGNLSDGYCRANFDTLTNMITGRFDPLENNPDKYLEVGSEIEKVDTLHLDGYRLAANSTKYLSTFERLTILDFENTSRLGCIFRCQLSAFADMPNNSSQIIIKYRDLDNSILDYVTLSRDNSGYFALTYAVSGQQYGSFTDDEVIWFCAGSSWDSGNNKTRLFYGYCEESLLGGSGYTAQDLPNSAIPYLQLEWQFSNNTEVGIELVADMLGDLEEGYSKCSFNLVDNVFNSRSGSIEDLQKYYYKDSSSADIYSDASGVLEVIGRYRRSYGDTYIDASLSSNADYTKFTYDGTDYYTYVNLYYETSPVFVLEAGEFVLYGFTTDTPEYTTITFTAYDDSTSITATGSGEYVTKKAILVLEKEPSKDKDVDRPYTVLQHILADNPIDSEAFTYESSILVCLDVANMKVTFGDFRNNLLKDWTAGDWNGDGYIFDSYLISHPMNSTNTSQFTGRRITDLVHTKNMPYLVTYFRRTETGELTDGSYVYPSQCQGSILWDWRTSGREGKWSSPSELYRPNKRTILDNGYIINKTNIRGLGRAYQVKLESVEGSQFILEGIVYDLKNDGRI